MKGHRGSSGPKNGGGAASGRRPSERAAASGRRPSERRAFFQSHPPTAHGATTYYHDGWSRTRYQGGGQPPAEEFRRGSQGREMSQRWVPPTPLRDSIPAMAAKTDAPNLAEKEDSPRATKRPRLLLRVQTYGSPLYDRVTTPPGEEGNTKENKKGMLPQASSASGPSSRSKVPIAAPKLAPSEQNTHHSLTRRTHPPLSQRDAQSKFDLTPVQGQHKPSTRTHRGHTSTESHDKGFGHKGFSQPRQGKRKLTLDLPPKATRQLLAEISDRLIGTEEVKNQTVLPASPPWRRAQHRFSFSPASNNNSEGIVELETDISSLLGAILGPADPLPAPPPKPYHPFVIRRNFLAQRPPITAQRDQRLNHHQQQLDNRPVPTSPSIHIRQHQQQEGFPQPDALAPESENSDMDISLAPGKIPKDDDNDMEISLTPCSGSEEKAKDNSKPNQGGGSKQGGNDAATKQVITTAQREDNDIAKASSVASGKTAAAGTDKSSEKFDEDEELSTSGATVQAPLEDDDLEVLNGPPASCAKSVPSKTTHSETASVSSTQGNDNGLGNEGFPQPNDAEMDDVVDTIPAKQDKPAKAPASSGKDDGLLGEEDFPQPDDDEMDDDEMDDVVDTIPAKQDKPAKAPASSGNDGLLGEEGFPQPDDDDEMDDDEMDDVVDANEGFPQPDDDATPAKQDKLEAPKKSVTRKRPKERATSMDAARKNSKQPGRGRKGRAASLDGKLDAGFAPQEDIAPLGNPADYIAAEFAPADDDIAPLGNPADDIAPVEFAPAGDDIAPLGNPADDIAAVEFAPADDDIAPLGNPADDIAPVEFAPADDLDDIAAPVDDLAPVEFAQMEDIAPADDNAPVEDSITTQSAKLKALYNDQRLLTQNKDSLKVQAGSVEAVKELEKQLEDLAGVIHSLEQDIIKMGQAQLQAMYRKRGRLTRLVQSAKAKAEGIATRGRLTNTIPSVGAQAGALPVEVLEKQLEDLQGVILELEEFTGWSYHPTQKRHHDSIHKAVEKQNILPFEDNPKDTNGLVKMRHGRVVICRSTGMNCVIDACNMAIGIPRYLKVAHLEEAHHASLQDGGARYVKRVGWAARALERCLGGRFRLLNVSKKKASKIEQKVTSFRDLFQQVEGIFVCVVKVRGGPLGTVWHCIVFNATANYILDGNSNHGILIHESDRQLPEDALNLMLAGDFGYLSLKSVHLLKVKKSDLANVPHFIA